MAAIGPGTAARARRARRSRADVVPERFVAEALVEALAELPLEGKPVLIARAAEARDVLPDALRERGAEVDVVALYETVAEQPEPGGARARAQTADFVTFTSSSTVRNFVEAVRRARCPRAPGSSRSARSPARPPARRASTVDVEAERHDIDGLVAALLAATS